jgi:hypothetical protein
MILDLAKTVIGAAASSRAADKQARAMREAQERALAAQRQAAADVEALYAPGLAVYGEGLEALQARAGPGAPNALKGATGGLSAGTFGGAQDPLYAAPEAFSYGIDDHAASPAYQHQLAQGIAAIEASQAAKGALGSGATAKALQRLGAGLGYQHFVNERDFAAGRYDQDRRFDRALYQDDRDYLTGRYDRQTQDLDRITGYGQGAAAQTAAALMGAGQAGANAAVGGGEARAAHAAAQGNIWSGAANGMFDAYGARRQAKAAPNALKMPDVGWANYRPYPF